MTTRTERLFVCLDDDALQGPESGVPAASLRSLAVPPALRDVVSSAVLYQESFAPGVELTERVLPDGAVRLVIPWGNGRTAGLVPGSRVSVIGPSAKPAALTLGGDMAGLTLTLQPGAVRRLLGLPACELTDQVLALEDVIATCNPVAHALRRLSDHSASRGTVNRLDESLSRLHLSDHTPISPQALLAWRLVATGACRRTSELADALALSERRLQSLFAQSFGLAPRTLIRLQQLRRCLAIRRLQPDLDWAGLALSGGFYDQSHLIRAFRDFCGLAPQAFERLVASGSSKTA